MINTNVFAANVEINFTKDTFESAQKIGKIVVVNSWSKWCYTCIKQGKIISEITGKGIRKTYFPKKTENRISHVRPHARDKNDCYDLPVKDKLTNTAEYTKHCFWLNASYVKDEIYLK